MAKPKHTLGPYKIMKPNNVKNTFWIDANDGSIAIADIKAIDVGEIEAIANAHLFAAAPQGYDCLEYIQAVIKSRIVDSEALPVKTLKHIDNLIASYMKNAKVEGRHHGL